MEARKSAGGFPEAWLSSMAGGLSDHEQGAPPSVHLPFFFCSVSQLDEISSGSLLTLKVTSFYIVFILYPTVIHFKYRKNQQMYLRIKKIINCITITQITVSC